MGTPEKKLELGAILKVDRCPHCNVANPRLTSERDVVTTDSTGRVKRNWRFYVCSVCGGVVSAWAFTDGRLAERGVIKMFPEVHTVDEAIPPKAREYLKQAIESKHAPAGAIMLAASSVDAMLKERGLCDGTLYSRIDKAAEEHMITDDAAAWAHEVRLDANDQRHADEAAELPSQGDAQRCIEFTEALAQFLFVLPAKVKQGRALDKKGTADAGD